MQCGGGNSGGGSDRGGDCKFPARSPGRLINFFDEMREEANWTELRRWCGKRSDRVTLAIGEKSIHETHFALRVETDSYVTLDVTIKGYHSLIVIDGGSSRLDGQRPSLKQDCSM